MNTRKNVVIVTGGSGLIGSAVVRRLAKQFGLVGFDRMGDPHPPIEAECVCVDIASDESVAAGLARVRFAYGERIASVVHLATYYDFSGGAKEVLGWEPQHSLREALPAMVAALKADPVGWYRDNKLEPPGWLAAAGEAAPVAGQEVRTPGPAANGHQGKPDRASTVRWRVKTTSTAAWCATTPTTCWSGTMRRRCGRRSSSRCSWRSAFSRSTPAASGRLGRRAPSESGSCSRRSSSGHRPRGRTPTTASLARWSSRSPCSFRECRE